MEIVRRIAKVDVGQGSLVSAIGFFVLLLLYHIVGYSCYWKSSEDLPIYAQALARLSLTDPNPWLSVRGVHLFYDHFDPILFAPALPAKWLTPTLVGLVTEFLLWGATAVLLYSVGRRRNISGHSIAAALALFVLNASTLRAVFYPIHPTAWSVLPCVWLCTAVEEDRLPGQILATLMLVTCKEVYVFVPAGLAVVALWRRRYRHALGFLVFGALLVLLILVFRPKDMHYSGFFVHGLVYLGKRLAYLVASLAIPAAVVIYMQSRRRLPVKGASAWVAFAPTFALTVLYGSMGAHQFVFLSALGAHLVMVNDLWQHGRRFTLLAFVGLLLLINGPYLGFKFLKDMRDLSPVALQQVGARARALDTAVELVAQHRPAAVRTTLSLAPHLVKWTDVELVELFENPRPAKGPWLVLDKKRPRYHWPQKSTQELIAIWRNEHPRVDILLDDEFALVARPQGP